MNFNKSCLVSINLSVEKTKILVGVFGCSIGLMSFPYLGLPMGTTKPKFEDLTGIMNIIERRITTTCSLLGLADRLTLVNSTLSSLSTYATYSLKLPKKKIEVIDKARRNCLWRGPNRSAKGKALIAWKYVCIPRNKGGMGGHQPVNAK